MQNIIETINSVLLTMQQDATNLHGILPFYTSDAPMTGKAIKQAYDNAFITGFMPIFDGGGIMLWSHNANLAYRFCHDIDHALHYDIGLGTTSLKSERYLNCLMAYKVYKRMLSLKYKHDIAIQAFFIGYADWVGQAEAYQHTNKFVEDQASFVYNYLSDCKGYKLIKAGSTSLSLQYMQSCLLDCGVAV